MVLLRAIPSALHADGIQARTPTSSAAPGLQRSLLVQTRSGRAVRCASASRRVPTPASFSCWSCAATLFRWQPLLLTFVGAVATRVLRRTPHTPSTTLHARHGSSRHTASGSVSCHYLSPFSCVADTGGMGTVATRDAAIVLAAFYSARGAHARAVLEPSRGLRAHRARQGLAESASSAAHAAQLRHPHHQLAVLSRAAPGRAVITETIVGAGWALTLHALLNAISSCVAAVSSRRH